MGAQIQHSRAKAAWALARRQHGVISRSQLLALGYSPGAIAHRVAKRRLHPVLTGVFAVGRPELARTGELMAALLACGDGAILSHSSAAELWGLLPRRPGAVHVSVTNGSDHRRRGIVVHRRRSLVAADITTRERIPVTSPACTLIDIAAGLGRRELVAAVNEADGLGLVDPDDLRAAVDGASARRGVARLRDVLDRETYTLTDSELERRFLPIARRAGLPRPQTQTYVNGFRVDFYWPNLQLVVETDGLRYHRTAAQQAKDRRRDQTHTAAGITTLRFTHAQVRFEPAHVERVLRSVSRRARSAGSSGPRRPRGA